MLKPTPAVEFKSSGYWILVRDHVSILFICLLLVCFVCVVSTTISKITFTKTWPFCEVADYNREVSELLQKIFRLYIFLLTLTNSTCWQTAIFHSWKVVPVFVRVWQLFLAFLTIFTWIDFFLRKKYSNRAYRIAEIYCHVNQCDPSVQYFAILHADKYCTKNL